MSKPKFITAAPKNITVTDDDDIYLEKNFYAVANSENISQVFAYVTNDYVIAQHEDVYDAIINGLKELNIKTYEPIVTIFESRKTHKNGGRIHIDISLPELNLDLLSEGDVLTMRLTTDNSYDGSTALRFNLGASCGKVNFYLPEKFSREYHRHTKNIDVEKIKLALEKGVETFKTKMKAAFQDLTKASLNPAQVSLFIDDLLKAKNKPMAKKYLEAMDKVIKSGANINNKWKLYRLTCQVLSEGDASIDVERSAAVKMLGKIRNLKKLESVTELEGETVISIQDTTELLTV